MVKRRNKKYVVLDGVWFKREFTFALHSYFLPVTAILTLITKGPKAAGRHIVERFKDAGRP